MQPQVPPAQGPPSHVAPEIVCVQVPRPTGNPNFNGKAGSILGGLHLACGILTFVLGIAAIGIQATLYQSGVGLWCGLLFFIPTGVCGIFAGKSKATGWIVGFMVMSIISVAIGCITLLSLASTGVAVDNRYTSSYECRTNWVTGRQECTYVYKYPSNAIIGFMVMSINTATLACVTLLTLSSIGVAQDNRFTIYQRCSDRFIPRCYYYRARTPNYSAKVGINGTLIAISLIEAVLCIVSAAYCCAGVCCCRQNTQQRVQVVNSGYPNLGIQYQHAPVVNRPQVLTNGQQVIYITNANPALVHYPQQPSTCYPVNGAYGSPPPYTTGVVAAAPPQVVPTPQVAPPPQDGPLYDNEKPPATNLQ